LFKNKTHVRVRQGVYRSIHITISLSKFVGWLCQAEHVTVTHSVHVYFLEKWLLYKSWYVRTSLTISFQTNNLIYFFTCGSYISNVYFYFYFKKKWLKLYKNYIKATNASYLIFYDMLIHKLHSPSPKQKKNVENYLIKKFKGNLPKKKKNR
jgi:hypothetical protein